MFNFNHVNFKIVTKLLILSQHIFTGNLSEKYIKQSLTKHCIYRKTDAHTQKDFFNPLKTVQNPSAKQFLSL